MGVDTRAKPMLWETVKRRKRTVLVVAGIVAFGCAIIWGGPFVILAPLALSLPIFLSVPVFQCPQCGNDGLSSGACKKCGTQMQRAGTILSGKIRLASEISLALVCLFFSFRFPCVPILLAHVLMGIFLNGQKRERWMNTTAIAFLLCLCLPVERIRFCVWP